MVELIPPADPHTLLPSLLACLPTAFASSRPPPALLTLLSPILRQRLELISSTSTSNTDSWLRLLCWNNEKAETLKEIVEDAHFEPHPASGEIEIGEVDSIKYKRFDEETLRARVVSPDWHLTFMYLWCTGSKDGNAWRLTELLPYDEHSQRDDSWSETVKEANDSSREGAPSGATRATEAEQHNEQAASDDDDYWASYDKTPARTPAVKKSPAPNGNNTSDADFYAQYGDVQPAMDNHDPSEETGDFGESTLKGGEVANLMSGQSSHRYERYLSIPEVGSEARQHVEDGGAANVEYPQPSSPSSRGSSTVARLEETAERYAASEIAIKQHISASMKSMYRLAKSSGMDREEFDRIVQRELETLSIFDRSD